MPRLSDWEQRFVAAMPAALDAPFAWGSADCAHLMAASVRACHGDDHPALSMLAGYQDKASAMRRLSQLGSLSEALAVHFEEVPVLMAQTGDIGIVETHGGEAGVVFIDGQAIGKAEHAPCFRVSVRAVARAFRV